jgi:5-methylcytosine-specific restriction endonuclease McrA
MEEYCKYCDDITQQDEFIGPFGPHYGKIVCNYCGNTTRWMKKPENQFKRVPNKYLPKDLDIHYCQICLRLKEDLINHEVLESHHIIEIQNNGEDKPENIMVACTPCHRIIHFLRIYLRRSGGNYA